MKLNKKMKKTETITKVVNWRSGYLQLARKKENTIVN